MSNEAEARIKINKLLEKSGWRLLEDKNGPKNVLVESSTTKSNSKGGSIDYLLLDKYGKPFIVLDKFIRVPKIDIQNQIVEKLKYEKRVVEGNKQLIEIYSKKIEDRINKIWGE